MNRLTLAAVVIVVALAAGGMGFFLLGGPTGTLVVGVTDSPVPSNVTHIYLTITDIGLRGETNSTVNFHVNATTFDLLALNNVTKFLGKSQIPVGNYTMLTFNVTSATATIAGSNVTLNVPSGVMKVAFAGQKLEVHQGATTRLVLDITPNLTNVSASYNLRPEVTVKSITYTTSTSSTTGT